MEHIIDLHLGWRVSALEEALWAGTDSGVNAELLIGESGCWPYLSVTLLLADGAD